MKSMYLLRFSERELNLLYTLINGQCFNWKEISPNRFEGVLYRQLVRLRRLDSETVQAEVQPNTHKDFHKVLMDYFNSSVSVEQLYKQWSGKNEQIKGLCERLPGIRVLRQHPWECTISFICSANNNISRITKLLESLRTTYGQVIHQSEGRKWHAFPSLKQMQEATTDNLRKLGFGYRADYLVQTTRMIKENGGQQWLEAYRNVDYMSARKELTKLKGIGRKVADCICLFSMDCHQVVPIDTHVFQLSKDLGFIGDKQDKKSLSDSLYSKIAERYVAQFGKYAGWAQQILFISYLNMYKGALAEPLPDKTTQQSSSEEPQIKKTRAKKIQPKKPEGGV